MVPWATLAQHQTFATRLRVGPAPPNESRPHHNQSVTAATPRTALGCKFSGSRSPGRHPRLRRQPEPPTVRRDHRRPRHLDRNGRHCALRRGLRVNARHLHLPCDLEKHLSEIDRRRYRERDHQQHRPVAAGRLAGVEARLTGLREAGLRERPAQGTASAAWRSPDSADRVHRGSVRNRQAVPKGPKGSQVLEKPAFGLITDIGNRRMTTKMPDVQRCC